ncbi:hypothetical protein QF023_003381 [Chryseobacterium sp. SLBN-27]|uniref:DUF2975 domain-containing protein n=1 Tax=Chryseobacterium sp. SLBN-27 TaxID=3042287 RepID=UPI00285D70E0|nr:DUF2975 domain-containing protein [Chryseobacterium sp. SLBN-27]MDR6159865.1 hypothetical protein [Chryseobacterium sp. SLBN-27]
MKIIGKNSVSQYISYLLLLLAAFFTVQLIYIVIGFAVSFYNFKTANNILSGFFTIGADVGWSKNEWTQPMEHMMKFKFFVPFTDQNLITGLFNPGSVLSHISNEIFITLFFSISYKFLREISKENVFNTNALLWLKRFGWLNIIYTAITLAIVPFTVKSFFAATYSVIIFLFFGALILFIVEFFKKGLELQEQVDLTI